MNDWVQRARAGDGEAFVTLIRAREQSLYKIARSFCRDPMDAEDAVAETVLDAWERLDTLKKPARFKTWLTTILVNNCRDILRQRQRVVALEEVPERTPREDDHSGLYFEELMACLPENCRPVMTLYYSEGFRVREIGEILGIPTGTVTVRLKRGREQLREKMRKGEILL